MQINDIFILEQYDEAYKFVIKNKKTTIKDLGNGKYQIVEIPPLNKNEQILQKRQERNFLLENTDKYMISDYPITESERQKFIKYRQYLRDIPQNAEFPEIEIKRYENFTTE